VKFVDENSEYILKMASEPLKYRDWMDLEAAW
jgi:hypothetical protein